MSLACRLTATQDNHTENKMVYTKNINVVVVNLLKILIDCLCNSLAASNHSFIGITFLHHNCSAEHEWKDNTIEFLASSIRTNQFKC